ncbi:MAG: STAS domain-containing protein [Planctomycetota bacterium]
MRSDFETERAANIQLRKRNGATVIHLSGHIDESAADALNAELERLLEDGVSRIVFELSEVKFMGSSGLGQVMRAYRELRDSDGYVRIVNPQPLIQDLFELTKLNNIITIHSSVEDAIHGDESSND